MRGDLKGCTEEERRTILEAAWYVATADRLLMPGERAFLEKIRRQSQISREIGDGIEQAARAGELKLSVPGSTLARTVMFEVVVKTAALDGGVSSSEKQSLIRLADLLGADRKEILEEARLETFSHPEAGGIGTLLGTSPATVLKDLGEATRSLREELERLRSLLRGRPPRKVAGRIGFPLIAILLAQAPILVGVLFFGWGILEAVMLFWVENVVIGLFNILKIMTATEDETGFLKRAAGFAGRIGSILFFIVHYGGFTFVHGLFLCILFGGGLPKLPSGGGGPLFIMSEALKPVLGIHFIGAACIILVGHGISFWRDYIGRGEYLVANVRFQMFQPYGRVLITHLSLFVLGIPCLFLPRLVAGLLVPIKGVFDIWSYHREQRRYEKLGEFLPAPAKGEGPDRPSLSHREALKRLVGVGAALIIVLAGLAGVIWHGTAENRERQQYAGILLSRIRPGMSARDVLEAPISWTMAFTNDQDEFQVDFRGGTQGKIYVRTSDEKESRMLGRNEFRKLVEEKLGPTLKNRKLHFYFRVTERLGTFSVIFDSEGRVQEVTEARFP